MAITYTRQPSGKVSVTKRTGFDAVSHGVKKVASAVKKAVTKPLDSYEAKGKAMQEAKRQRNIEMIERGFGSVENYRSLDPMFRSRRTGR